MTAEVATNRAVQRGRPLTYHGSHRHLKRTLDLVVTAASLPVALVLMAVIAVLVKTTSRGPVLFRQERVGQHGEMITVLKFRTMHRDALARLRADELLYRRYVDNDFKLPIDEDPRITRIGRILRRTSLDELPQLFNVLGGSMSLVGPRPIVVDELEAYGDLAWAYLESKPGITGRWQTDGRNHVRYPERAELDAEYLENWTIWSDVRILLRTIPAVLCAHGSH